MANQSTSERALARFGYAPCVAPCRPPRGARYPGADEATAQSCGRLDANGTLGFQSRACCSRPRNSFAACSAVLRATRAKEGDACHPGFIWVRVELADVPLLDKLGACHLQVVLRCPVEDFPALSWGILHGWSRRFRARLWLPFRTPLAAFGCLRKFPIAHCIRDALPQRYSTTATIGRGYVVTSDGPMLLKGN